VIGYVDKPPLIEPHGDGFILTVSSGSTETRFMLTLHAMTGLCGAGMLRVKEAQAKAAAFAMCEVEPFKPKRGKR
jgi:hypothetical protein